MVNESMCSIGNKTTGNTKRLIPNGIKSLSIHTK